MKVLLARELNLMDEDKILAKLNSPYLIKYVDSFKHGFTFCIITEFCPVNFKLKKSKDFIIIFYVIYLFSSFLNTGW